MESHLTPQQTALLRQVLPLLEREQQIEAAWLAGSLGRGSGDEVSDVDLLALCSPGTRGKVSQALASALEEEMEPLLLNVLFGGAVINVVAEEWQRFDVSLVEANDLARYDPTRLTELFNRTDAKPSGRTPDTYEPGAQSLLAIVQEFLRVIGLASVGITRGDMVLMISGVEHLRRLTTDLMLEESRVGPWDRGGALSRKALLTPSQYGELEGLPPLSAEPSSIKANNEAFAGIFLPRAKRLCAEVGVQWPARLESATRAHLAQTIDFKI
jgi:predicted nucleotidyltransferase